LCKGIRKWNYRIFTIGNLITKLEKHDTMTTLEHFDLYLKLIRRLSSGTRHHRQTLIDDFEMTERTFDRYISELRNLGFEIPRAKDGMYWIDRSLSRTELANLVYISDEELTILAHAIEAIDESNALKSDLRRKLSALLDPTLITKSILHPERAHMVKLLGIAIEKKQQVLISKYHSGHSKIIRDRKVEPISISANFQMLCAYDLEDRMPKNYKISRMESIRILDTTFRFQQQHRELKSDPFRISGETERQISFSMTLTACNLLKEEYPLAAEYISQTNDERYLYTGPVYGDKGVGRFILSLPGEIEVLEDNELKGYLQKSIKRYRGNF